MELGAIIVWGGFAAIAVVMWLLGLAWKRGRISQGGVLFVGLSCGAIFNIGLCAFLWASGGQSWLRGAAVGAGAFLAVLAVVEVVWRFSGRSILGEMVSGLRPPRDDVTGARL